MDAVLSESNVREMLKTRFLSLYCMVLADENVDIKELEALYRIGRDAYNLSEEEINKMIVGAGTSVPRYDKVEDKIKLLYEMAQIAWADGIIDASERQLLRKYALRFDFFAENVDEIIDFLLSKAKDNIPFDVVMSEIENA